MPNRTIYIRQADLELWNSLADKSRRVSEMLHSEPFTGPTVHVSEKDESIAILNEKAAKTKGLCKIHGCPKSVCSMMKH